MATRRTTPPPPQAPVLTADQLRRRIDRLQSCIDELEAFDAEKVQKRYGEPEVLRLEAMIDEDLAAAFGHRTPAYNRYREAATLDHGPKVLRTGPAFGLGPHIDYDARDARDARRYLAEGKIRSIALLRQAISTLQQPQQQPPCYRRGQLSALFLDPGDCYLYPHRRFLISTGYQRPASITQRETGSAGSGWPRQQDEQEISR
jgi:hypothetical protein